MADYRKILQHVRVFEGGYSADPVDNASRNPSPVMGLDKRYPGLPVHTNKGVTWSTWMNYARKKGFPATGDSFVNMTEAQWVDLLKTLYWDAVKGDSIRSQGVAEMLFEAVWGGGSKSLNEQLQRYLQAKGFSSVIVDGVVGPITVQAINGATKTNKEEQDMILYLTNERLKYLQGLNDWWKYSKGWTRRVQELKDRAIAYITDNPTTGGGIVVALAAAAYLLTK
jgi:lysozyme family protein